MRTLLLLLLLLPQLVSAKVYMCVDQATGKTSFTDRGCETPAARAEVRVPPANANSGSRVKARETARTDAWLSDRDTRKTGRDYNDERRRLEENRPTANIAAGLADGEI